MPLTPLQKCSIISLGIGKDVKAERRMKTVLAECEFHGADPAKEDNAELFSEVGTFYNMAVGDRNGSFRSYVLEDVYRYQEVIIPNIRFFPFLKKNGALENEGIHVCQINIEMHLPDEKEQNQLSKFLRNNFVSRQWIFINSEVHPILGHIRLFMINGRIEECRRRVVDKMPNDFGVILLNQHAVRMTLNFLCNTKHFDSVHRRIVFIVMDKTSEVKLRKQYPKLNIVLWLAPVLQTPFKPYDVTYMSFFLMRTNIIKALQAMGKGFWMLQADTIWRKNFFAEIDVGHFRNSDILLDQQGYSGTAEIRQRTMNGANFYLPPKKSSQQLVDSWLAWQKSVYITDPDLVKIFCLREDFICDYIPYSLAAGWEWIYGDQKNPPVIIQMDGETGGNKEKILEKYKFWFLDDQDNCKPHRVKNAIQLIENGRVQRVVSQSKSREQFYLKIGELLNQMPIFGYYSSIYDGLTSLYLQLF
ncbi:unnamed protein product [Caenorhabditis bovis]|uniref:Nucleotide-diphospho-sugar transferase domain-containing protein n=1 Tax=Caenorhabditis bovis TaxID=2654633 RepID=A0A8S1E880_9PELO|nr:unnamed protein product [Caenorhabditis bovis]